MSIAKASKIFVAGHRGMVGSAIVRRLASGGYTRVITRSRSELDLLDQQAVHDCRLKSRITFSWQQPRWAGLRPTTPIAPTSFIRT